MKKTISIHIKGFPFIIEEIAYTRLENYLNRLKSALQGQEGADEIIEDIEIRIAELLNGKTTQFKQVIEDNDVIDVLNTLGDPSDYAENDEQPHAEERNYSSSNPNEYNERRLYRDTENGYIGGVCSGLASYFGIDPTIIRLIWAGAFFIGGIGFLLYIILWAIIPKANSSIDRLKMKGKPINVDTVKEEVERAAQNVSEKSKQLANQFRNDKRIKDGLSTFKKVVRLIIGAIFLSIGFSSLVVLITFVFGTPQFIPATSDEGFLSITSFAKLVLNDSLDLRLAWISFYFCSISFVIFFLLGGLVALFNIKNKWYRYVNFLLIFAGIIGFSIGMIVASRTGRDYAVSGEIEKEIVSVHSERLTILPQSNQLLKNSDYVVKNKSFWKLYIGKNNIVESGISVRYYPSKDSLYHIILEKEANAHTLEQAVNRAKNIEYNYQINNDTLIIPAFYSYPLSDKIRNQEVSLHIYIPKGKTIAVADKIVDLSSKSKYDAYDDFEDKQQCGKIKGDGSYRHRD